MSKLTIEIQGISTMSSIKHMDVSLHDGLGQVVGWQKMGTDDEGTVIFMKMKTYYSAFESFYQFLPEKDAIEDIIEHFLEEGWGSDVTISYEMEKSIIRYMTANLILDDAQMLEIFYGDVIYDDDDITPDEFCKYIFDKEINYLPEYFDFSQDKV